MDPKTDSPAFILFAEDDDDDFLMIREAMEDAGLTNEYHRVLDGRALLSWLRDPANPRPSVIMLDLNMVPMGGMEALQQIRTDPDLRDIDVVVLTTSKADEQRCREKGVRDYQVKPTDHMTLMRILTETLSFYTA